MRNKIMQSPSYLHATNLVTGGAVHHPDAESEDQPEVSQSPAGFSIIHTLHMCFGVSYFGYHTKPLAKYLTLATTLLFLTVLILMNFPCLFHCTFNIKHLFTSGLSPDFTSFIIIYLDLYHVIGSSLILIFRGYRIQKFFDRVDDYCRNFGVELVAAQKKKLTSISVRITVYNILHVVGEVLILIFLVEHKLIKKTDRWTGGFTMEKRALNSTMTGMTPTIELDERTSYFINLLLKAMIVLYSKMIESLIVYISSYVSLILKRLEVRYDKFIYAPKGGRSIEVAKVAYIEAQNLIKESDEVFSHTTFDPLFINVLIILIGIFEVTDGIGRRREIDVDDWHEMYNSFSAFFAIYMCCTAGDEVEEEMSEVVQSISYINGEAFSDIDYRSYQLLLTVSQNNQIIGLTAGRWFPLNKKLLFMLTFFFVIYTMLLLQNGMRGS